MCIYRLNSHLKRSFESIMEKNAFHAGAFFYIVHEKFIKVFLLQETSPAPEKILAGRLKVCLLHENLSQLINLIIGLGHFVFLFLNDIYSS